MAEAEQQELERDQAYADADELEADELEMALALEREASLQPAAGGVCEEVDDEEREGQPISEEAGKLVQPGLEGV